LSARRPDRRRASLSLLAAALCALAAGCSSSGSSTGAAPPTSTAATTASTTTAATAATTGTTETLAGAGTAPVEAPASAKETALLERVALGRHAGYDRIVFQFRNVVPGYRVEYRNAPFAEDGSGKPVSVNGNAFLVLRLEPASGYDLNAGEGQLVYRGSPRLEGADAGTSAIEEAVRTGDFESVLTWVVGLARKADFRVRTLSSPARLVLDVRNG
jgi:hypothetical protein